MTGVTKPTPLQAFESNMDDARHLVLLAECTTNSRARRMRAELRERVGSAIKVPVRKRAELDCLESADAYLIFKPGSRLGREAFNDHRPLLRQALVAACAATETYLADKAMTKVADLTTSEEAATAAVRKMPMTVGDWLVVNEYTYRRRGLHEKVVRPYVEEFASTDPSKIGKLMSMLGITDWTKKVDGARRVKRGETQSALDRIAKRRNRIVHSGDRAGRSRATLSIDEVKRDLEILESVVEALEMIL